MLGEMYASLTIIILIFFVYKNGLIGKIKMLFIRSPYANSYKPKE